MPIAIEKRVSPAARIGAMETIAQLLSGSVIVWSASGRAAVGEGNSHVETQQPVESHVTVLQHDAEPCRNAAADTGCQAGTEADAFTSPAGGSTRRRRTGDDR